MKKIRFYRSDTSHLKAFLWLLITWGLIPRRLRRVVIPAKAGIQKSKLDAPGLLIAGAGLSGPA